MLRFVAAPQLTGFLVGSPPWLLSGHCWCLMVLNQIFLFLRDKSSRSGERTQRDQPRTRCWFWLCLGMGKANSPELKALSQFSIFPKRGSLPDWISGLWRGALSVAEWGCWRCSPCPRAGLAAAGGLQCSDPACSSCCSHHPETFPGNLPVPCCGLPKL